MKHTILKIVKNNFSWSLQAENNIEDTQNRNISLITSDYQVNWLEHSDFTIPPPPMPTQQQEQHVQGNFIKGIDNKAVRIEVI